MSVNGNMAMNYVLQTIFEKEYDFVPVADVFQGMQQLKRNQRISALVVDLDYHPQQAWDMIEHIKSSRLFRIPVVVLATENTETLRQKCYEYEVDEIFFKPFNPVDLIAALKGMTTLNLSNTW